MMQINVSGRHVEITPALRDYVYTRFQKLEKHFDRISQIHTILSVEKLRHKAESTVHMAGCEIYAESVSEDMYTAIDSLSDKLTRQVQKHKDKMRGV